MTSRRPWTASIVRLWMIPTAFLMTRLVRPAFDTVNPEKPKFKYRVKGGKRDREHDPEVEKE